MSTTRPTAVAGLFYPAEREQLRNDVQGYLDAADTARDKPVPKAIIAPHAGYIYSGPVAASAYARLQPARDRIHRVVLLGPSHRVPFRGLATSGADTFSTPLGEIALDRDAIQLLLTLPQVQQLDEAHAQEHSLEVHLPFLQETIDNFTLVPLVVGDASPGEVAEALEQLWGDDETLIVVSSDLSHYHDYTTAQQMDRATSAAIESLQIDSIHGDNACGYAPVSGLLYLVKQHGLHASTIDLRNSFDTAGANNPGAQNRVVGYGAYVIN
jgi:MEMO1 family protein